jgi:hypothetical protein
LYIIIKNINNEMLYERGIKEEIDKEGKTEKRSAMRSAGSGCSVVYPDCVREVVGLHLNR